MDSTASDTPSAQDISALCMLVLLTGVSCAPQPDTASSTVSSQAPVCFDVAAQHPCDSILIPVMTHATPELQTAHAAGAQLSICADGRIYGDGKLLWNPEKADDALALRAWLQSEAEAMPKACRPGSAADSPLVPSSPLRICADRNAPFVLVARLIEECDRKKTGIWRIEVSALVPKELGTANEHYVEGYVDLSHPIPPEITYDILVCPLETTVRVMAPGSRRRRGDSGGPSSSNSTSFEYSEDRIVEYSLGPFRTRELTELAAKTNDAGLIVPGRPTWISAGWGATCAEALGVVNLQLAAGARSINISCP